MTKAKKEKLSLEELLEQAIVKEEDRPYEVPKNWLWVDCCNIFDIVYGKNLPTNKLTKTGYPVFGANGHIGFYSKYTYENEQALMSCRGAYSGTMNISSPYSYITNNSLVISPKTNGMSSKFVAYLFEAMDRSSLISGSAQPQVTVQAFTGYYVPFMPLAEQQRIVKVLDSLFEKLDTAKELVQNALDSFENRKATILHKAIAGELTEKWRGKNDLENWGERTLNDVILEKPRNGYSPNGVPYVTNYKNLTLSATTTGVFNGECFKYVDIDIDDSSYLWLKNGDILIQRSNSLEYVGTCAIYDGRDNEYIYPDLMMKIKANEFYINPRFLYYILSDIDTKKYYRNNATGTSGNMPKINQKIVMNTPIHLPSKQEQQEIVRILDILLKNEQRAKELCDVIEKIDLMKKAILARAFRGKLGTNNPDEESAIELLKEVLKEKSGEV